MHGDFEPLEEYNGDIIRIDRLIEFLSTEHWSWDETGEINLNDISIAIHEAITLGKPLFERVVTVTGDAIKNPGNFKVKNGTNAAELVEAAGGFKTQPKKVISGGPMMGFAMFGLDVPTTKTTSALLCLTDDGYGFIYIRCSLCKDILFSFMFHKR